MLSKEDKHDVKTHMGKALANKVSKATKDRVTPRERRPGELMHKYHKAMGSSKEVVNASKEKKGFRDYELNK